eukprot:COSAG05_NODE_18371_length_309_cov_0.971429_1_plen_38_part_10
MTEGSGVSLIQPLLDNQVASLPSFVRRLYSKPPQVKFN